jgi:hypothetical protein
MILLRPVCVAWSCASRYRPFRSVGDARRPTVGVEVDFGGRPRRLAAGTRVLDLTPAGGLVPAEGPIDWTQLDKLPHCLTVEWSGPDRTALSDLEQLKLTFDAPPGIITELNQLQQYHGPAKPHARPIPGHGGRSRPSGPKRRTASPSVSALFVSSWPISTQSTASTGWSTPSTANRRGTCSKALPDACTSLKPAQPSGSTEVELGVPVASVNVAAGFRAVREIIRSDDRRVTLEVITRHDLSTSEWTACEPGTELTPARKYGRSHRPGRATTPRTRSHVMKPNRRESLR